MHWTLVSTLILLNQNNRIFSIKANNHTFAPNSIAKGFDVLLLRCFMDIFTHRLHARHALSWEVLYILFTFFFFFFNSKYSFKLLRKLIRCNPKN